MGPQDMDTCLAHAVNKLRSIEEIDDAHTMSIKMSIKMSAQYACTIESELGAAPNPAGSLGPGGQAARP